MIVGGPPHKLEVQGVTGDLNLYNNRQGDFGLEFYCLLPLSCRGWGVGGLGCTCQAPDTWGSGY